MLIGLELGSRLFRDWLEQSLIPQTWRICAPLPDHVVAQRLRPGLLSGPQAGPPARDNAQLTPLLVQLLHNRGIDDPAEFDAFLAADSRLAHDPFGLADMDKAVTRIMRALLGDELIAVYGDFDADGITATVLLVQGISLMGGRVVYYIPHRHDEGHGLNYPALEALKEQGVSLLITVDCGINGIAELEQGQKLGLDIVITDHHVAPRVTPPALAAIDPKRPDSAYPFRELAGVGVAFKLLQALFEATNRAGQWEEALDLVVLGTIADMVPLGGENRYLVRRGLEVLNRSRRVGVLELVASAGLEMGRLDEDHISYMLGPRLNASGRMDHAITSYELLATSSREEARQLAAALESNNSERQRLTAEFLAKAKEALSREGADSPLLMVSGPDYPHGVAGVVAGKLADEFCRPTIVVRLDGDIAKGSARSIPQFDIVGALAECEDLLTRYGGHHQAAGFVTPVANVGPLRERLVEIAGRRLEGVDLRPVIGVDAEVPLSTLSGDTYRHVTRLAPFGQGNPVPTLLSRGVKLLTSRKMGSGDDHLKLKLRDGKVVWDAVAFDLGGRQLAPQLDIVYQLEREDWGGRPTLRLNILDFVPT